MAIDLYRTAIVTGASSGIGEAVTERLIAAGLTVHAIARGADRLGALAARTGCVAHAVDVRDTAALEALIPGLEADILVINAATNRPGTVETAKPGDFGDILAVNVEAPMQLARLALPGMRARSRGHVVIVSSISGHHVFPGNAAYSASKSAVSVLAQQLRVDLHGTRVRVTEVSPGRTATGMFEATYGDPEIVRQRFLDGYETLLPGDIADAIGFALAAPPRMTVSFMEVLPTMQVPGGVRFAKTEG